MPRATSTQGWIRRLGRRWQRLHQLAYVAAPAGVLHFWWLVKSDVREPLTFAAVMVVLFGVRVWWSLRTRLAERGHRAHHGLRQPG